MASHDTWFDDFERRFDDMRKELVSRFQHQSLALPADRTRTALVDIEDKGSAFSAKVELPGLRKEDVHLDVTEHAFRVWGTTQHEEESKRRGWVRHERTSASFERYLALPDEVDPDAAKATFHDGVLEVTMPKAANGKGRERHVPIA
jgi:HSP20 family protein